VDSRDRHGQKVLYPSEIDVFEHANILFGFRVHGLSDRLTIHLLERLLPCLRQVNDHLLAGMAEFCQRYGHRDWGEANLRPEFDRRRDMLAKMDKQEQDFIERMCRYHFPSDAELMEDLDGIEQQEHYYGHLLHWCEEFDHCQDDRARRGHILEQWLVQSLIMRGFQLVVDAISEHGTGPILSCLRSTPSPVIEIRLSAF